MHQHVPGRLFTVSVLAIASLGMAPTAKAEILFEERTAEAGISQNHTARYFISGQAWADYDGDGWVDLYLTDSGGPNTLYRNRGDGTFEVSAHNADVALAAHISGGASWADYDNDGRDDLLVLGLGLPVLLRNTATGFEDVTAAMGLTAEGQGESAAWADFDGDGFLDLYIVHWLYDEDESDPRAQDRLYRNLQGQGFEDVSGWLDTARMSGPGFAAAFTDYDNDGDPDLYVVNDKHFGNPLWRNDGPGCGGWCFVDVSVATGADRPAWGMGLAVGDYDRDGDFDFYYSSIGEMVLLENPQVQGSGSWLDVAPAMRCDADVIGWGVIFEDFDNDFDLDLYAATVESSPSANDRVYRNDYPLPFTDISAVAGASDSFMTVGVAKADYDRDGAMDLVVGNFGESYRLLRNATEASSGWLQVELVGGGPVNRNAVGSRVILTLDDGRRLERELRIGESIGASHERMLHFGLDDRLPSDLTIVWPDGTTTHRSINEIDQRVSIVYTPQIEILVDGFEAAP